jgi:hypothetical protein
MAQITKADIDEMVDIIRRSNALVAAAPEMLAMLKRLEWCQMTLDDGVTFHETVHYCPKCGYAKTEGHKPTCELAALIARAEGRTPTPAE